MNPQKIATGPAKEIALNIFQRVPGVQVRSLGTDIHDDLLEFDSALEKGEILEVVMDERRKVKVVVTTLVGNPHERVQVIEAEGASANEAEEQSFAEQIRGVLCMS